MKRIHINGPSDIGRRYVNRNARSRACAGTYQSTERQECNGAYHNTGHVNGETVTHKRTGCINCTGANQGSGHGGEAGA